jgi:hypothetical protein
VGIGRPSPGTLRLHAKSWSWSGEAGVEAEALTTGCGVPSVCSSSPWRDYPDRAFWHDR